MYSDPQSSQFRRPWSPEPFEPYAGFSNEQPEHNPYPMYPQAISSRQRREGSDVSVEALDLADYARTLRIRQAEDPYPPYPSYPPSPLRQLASHDSLSPPSLASRGGTRSSNTHTSSSRSRNRHFSLPPSSRHNSANPNHSGHSPRFGEPQIVSPDSEIDISHFPAWSRNWYNSPMRGATPPSPQDIYTPLPTSHFNATAKRSPFDPGYIHRDSDGYSSDPYGYVPTSSLGHDSTRDLLPWSNDPLESNPPLDSVLKEERMRMLEQEFGANGSGKGRASTANDYLDENGKPLIGTVDSRGNLVTRGPKKRMAMRMLQIVLALTASIPAIYAAAVIKPKEPPPPANKPSAFVLYVLSVLTLLLLLYLFVIRPCCCTGKRRKSAPDNPLSNGMMVLPVHRLPGGKKTKKNKGGKKGKGGKGGDGQGDVQVNLIVDPNVFGRREEEDSEDEDGGDLDGSIPGAYGTSKKRKPRRRSVFAGLAMEENWKRARGWAKKLAAIDVAGLVLWGAAFVFIMIGKRCPSGGFDGWCNAYNVSSAAACLLSVAFGVSTFFDVKDLHDSKASPRTRA
ncbi:hypothetical protein Hypma_011803 [Hypsizygus marmoreus]|uniref:Uncharacterized protein n=1 Tax=Hypsizygus marmoreus TaxID=39966 RepID=A0A369JFZ3_HYPMA|nr:hypothetical protein Hypma_011803 [Hypsizygus marmoreus]